MNRMNRNTQRKFLEIAQLAVLLITAVVFSSCRTQPPTGVDDEQWPRQRKDLPTDPEIQWGELDTGLRYAVRQHSEPPGRVSLRLYVHTGSLMEDDDERGLAHFLEHMAFNGTEHFEAGEMVKYFQRLGMAFGADTNAYTGFNETVYQLELPENDQEMLKKGLLLLRDYASRMTLETEQIDKERGVVLSELRTRDTVQRRTFEARLNFLFPESLIPHRLPGGTEAVIRNAPRRRFVNFYREWYIPPRITVVGVGDIAPSKLAGLITDAFTDMERSAQSPVRPDMGSVPEVGTVAGYHYESEAPATTMAIQTVIPYRRGPDSQQRRIESLRRQVAYGIIKRRLDILARKKDSPFSRGSATVYDWLDFATIAGIEVKCAPEDWEKALTVAETELRRALKYGFTQGEIDYQKAQILTRYRRAADTAATRRSRQIARGIVRAVNTEDVYTTPATDLKIAEEALANLSPEILRKVFCRAWDATDSRYIFAAGNLDLENPHEKLLAAYRASRNREVADLARQEESEFAYQDFGPAGKVQSRSEVHGLNITQLKFENNVFANLKKTQFEADTIHIGIRFGGGKLAIPRDRPELGVVAERVFVPGGLQKHSYTDIESLFADQDVEINFAVDSDAFVLKAVTSPEDLDAQLRLLTAYLTAPGYRQEAMWQARREVPKFYRHLQYTPEGVFRDRVTRFLHSGDPRFGYPSKQSVMNVQMTAVRQWLSEPLANSMLEVSVVGDFQKTKVIRALADTLGALPARRAEKRDFSEARQVEFPTNLRRKSFDYETENPKSLAMVLWPTTGLWQIKKSRRLNVLSRIMADRLRVKIREEMGETYSPSAYSHTSDTFENYGYMATRIITDPGKAAGIAAIVREIGAGLADKGATQDEVSRAVKPLVSMLGEYLRTNEYWLGTVLMGSTEKPVRLAWARSIRQDYSAIGQKEVNEVAEEYLSSGRALTVLVQPGANADQTTEE